MANTHKYINLHLACTACQVSSKHKVALISLLSGKSKPLACNACGAILTYIKLSPS